MASEAAFVNEVCLSNLVWAQWWRPKGRWVVGKVLALQSNGPEFELWLLHLLALALCTGHLTSQSLDFPHL